jgi:uncharacterized protein YggU (UPF0235/DUF167 family)
VNLDRRSRLSDVRFAVRLTPRGGADRIEGVNDAGALAVRVAAAPVGGGANAALLRLLAEDLGVAKGAVRLVAGASGRKTCWLAGPALSSDSGSGAAAIIARVAWAIGSAG